MTVNIVVPIYKSSLSDNDRISLDRLVSVLGDYPVTVICPEGVDLSEVESSYPAFSYQRFSPEFFASKQSYNHLMLSKDFYGRFLEWDYVLIYQLDAFVFRNEMDLWCNKGYDYIGAPWILKPKHRSLIYKACSALKSAVIRLSGGVSDRHIHRGKVGNGGFSLRRTRTCYDFLVEHKERVDYYLARCTSSRYYEDVFWAVEPAAAGADFKVPSLEEALSFAFDIYPDQAYKMTNGRLPFGCHAFTARKMKGFWGPIIERVLSEQGN